MEDLLTIVRYVYWTDFILFLVFYLLGTWSIKKQMKDTWKGAKSMEWKKSRKLSNEWEKAHPILDFYQSFKYEVERKYELPGEFIYNVKYFIERGKKGFSKRDVWGFDYYLSDIIIKGLKDLKEMAHGCPCGEMIGVQSIDVEDEDSKVMIKWKKTLDEIIWTFEITKNIQNHHWIPVTDENDRTELKKYVRRLNTKTKDEDELFDDLLKDVEPTKYHLMTVKEMKRYNEGWELFKKFYFDLWD